MAEGAELPGRLTPRLEGEEPAASLGVTADGVEDREGRLTPKPEDSASLDCGTEAAGADGRLTPRLADGVSPPPLSRDTVEAEGAEGAEGRLTPRLELGLACSRDTEGDDEEVEGREGRLTPREGELERPDELEEDDEDEREELEEDAATARGAALIDAKAKERARIAERVMWLRAMDISCPARIVTLHALCQQSSATPCPW